MKGIKIICDTEDGGFITCADDGGKPNYHADEYALAAYAKRYFNTPTLHNDESRKSIVEAHVGVTSKEMENFLDQNMPSRNKTNKGGSK